MYGVADVLTVLTDITAVNSWHVYMEWNLCLHILFNPLIYITPAASLLCYRPG
jgi:hypothetical protein